MNIKEYFIASFAIVAMNAAQAATVLDITDASPGNFGRVAGVIVDFSDTTGGSWAPDALVDGSSYYIDSFSVTKNSADTTYTDLWVGVYTGLDDANAPSGFLGASQASVAWGAGVAGDQFTWTFSDDFSATVGSGNQLVFMFQTAAGEQTSKLLQTSDGPLALQRLPTSASNIYANEGAAIWHGSFNFGQTNDRIPLMNLQVSAIPEPSAAIIGAFGLLALLRRRR